MLAAYAEPKTRLRVGVKTVTYALLLASCSSAADKPPELGETEHGFEGQTHQTSQLDAGAPPKSKPTSTSVEGADQIVAVGHGEALLSNGRYVTPDEDFVRAAQAHYISRLRDEASADVQAKFEREKVELQREAEESGDSAIATDGKLIHWLLDTVRPRDADRVAMISNYLLYAAGQEVESYGITETSTQGAKYMADCIAAGVPRPPDWGTTGPKGWNKEGALPLEQSFIGKDTLGADIYTYKSESPRGICFALPRYQAVRNEANQPTGERYVSLLGIICQGNDTSRACFWDNSKDRRLPTTGIYPIVDSEEEPGKFASGGDLELSKFKAVGGECTDCHRGENVFIVHPKTRLNQLDHLYAKGWVRPLVHPNWHQNRKPSRKLDAVPVSSNEGSCVSCHSKEEGKRFGQLDSAYCGFLRTAMRGDPSQMPPTERTMPFGDGEGDDIARYAKHENAINQICPPELGSFRGPDPAAARFEAASSPWSNSFSGPQDQRFVGDFNNDGQNDLLRIGTNGAFVALSSGRRFGNSSSWQAEIVADQRVWVGDFDGKGKDDLIVVPADGSVLVAISSGAAFARPRAWDASISPSQAVVVGDFNNDRKDDLFVFAAGDGSGASLFTSNGEGFDPPRRVANDLTLGTDLPLTGDVDADGRVDLVLVPSTSGGQVRIVDGADFSLRTADLSVSAGEGNHISLGDADGDGFADLVSVEAGGGASVFRSDGRTFVRFGQTLWLADFGTNSTKVQAADLDADGRVDLVDFRPDSSVVIALALPPVAPAGWDEPVDETGDETWGETELQSSL